MDARQRRSQERLHEAVLRLAEQTPVTELTATEVARAAGVHRSTFYEHAASPGDLLRAALTDELDDVRRRHLAAPGTDLAEALGRTTADVAAHVAAHAGVYRRGLAPDAGAGSLVTMLAEHFLASSRMLVEQGRLHPVAGVDGLPSATVADAALGFVAFGTVGAVRAWLDAPEPHDPAAFLALDRALLPTWWG